MNPVTISAPGKLMLFGEHAVVYGRPSIVTAISERLTVTESDHADMMGDTRFVDAAQALWGNSTVPLRIQSSFSGTYGFGSSSAVTVAVLRFLRPSASKRDLFDAAYRVVTGIQGKASGADIAAAVWGGTLFFRSGGKTVEPVSVASLPLVVAYSGVKADTVSMINNVSDKMARQPEAVNRLFDAIGSIVEDARKKMEEGDWERVGMLMDFNQEYLRDLGVSTERLESMIAAAKGAGAWGAKLSGAGGGDCMIAVVSQEKRAGVERAIGAVGGQVIHITGNAPGVRREP